MTPAMAPSEEEPAERRHGILTPMTVDQIIAAVRALSVPERLRVIEIVAHEAAGDVPAAVAAPGAGITLIEHNGVLLADADVVLPADVFDHRQDREARDARVWGER